MPKVAGTRPTKTQQMNAEMATRVPIAALTTPLAFKVIRWVGYKVSLGPLAIATIIGCLAVSLLQPSQKWGGEVNEVMRFAAAVPLSVAMYAFYDGIPRGATALGIMAKVCLLAYVAQRIVYAILSRIYTAIRRIE